MLNYTGISLCDVALHFFEVFPKYIGKVDIQARSQCHTEGEESFVR
jgi:hypothetical protein